MFRDVVLVLVGVYMKVWIGWWRLWNFYKYSNLFFIVLNYCYIFKSVNIDSKEFEFFSYGVFFWVNILKGSDVESFLNCVLINMVVYCKMLSFNLFLNCFNRWICYFLVWIVFFIWCSLWVFCINFWSGWGFVLDC